MNKEDINRYAFTVYANSMEDAERLRNIVIEGIQAYKRETLHDGDTFPEWDIDEAPMDYGPQEDESEDDTV